MATFGLLFWLAPCWSTKLGVIKTTRHHEIRTLKDVRREKKTKQNKRGHQENWVNLWVPELSIFPKKQNLPEDSEQRVWKRQRN